MKLMTNDKTHIIEIRMQIPYIIYSKNQNFCDWNSVHGNIKCRVIKFHL